MIKIVRYLAACIVVMFGSVTWLQAQTVVAGDRCGTMQALESTFKRDPAARARFVQQQQEITRMANERKAQAQTLRVEGTATTFYIPVVFHIVLTNTATVTDAQIQAQIDRLNVDYAGLNADSTMIPTAFKPLFAKTRFQFKLAQRTPDDLPSTGITRTTTTHSSYSMYDNSVKYTSKGGADAWDVTRFYNVWITNLSDGILGYATFPGQSVTAEEGVVIHYISLPGGQSPYDLGRTLTHETGHYLNLIHIWGDENGCTGTDYCDDTPNQGTYTSGCPGGKVRTDNCTTTSPGIMYENYMDYTDDACMVMFTNDQLTRMETAFSVYRASLATSNGADPVAMYDLDASAKIINAPLQRVCTATFSPVITLRNKGKNTLTQATIYASIDNGAASSVTNWTGSLVTFAETPVTLNALTTTEGIHTLKVIVSAPNNGTDEDLSNDTLTSTYQYYQAMEPPVTESFESSTFPPKGWDIINPDNSYTWERVVGYAKTGNASVVMRNSSYAVNGQKDYLRLPTVNITSADSAFMTFQVAAAVTSDPASTSNPFDTLEVWASTDCGVTFTSLYKKWDSTLITRRTPVDGSFTPMANEWRKDSVNLTPYIGKGPLLLAFVNTAEYENNIYLDDINVYSLNINTNLKAKGFMITPNPTTGNIYVQFYPNPAYVKGINIYSSTGQRVASRVINGAGSSIYSFDLAGFASGVYIVQVVLSDKTITQKVIKR
jgi:hypothetical protein